MDNPLLTSLLKRSLYSEKKKDTTAERKAKKLQQAKRLKQQKLASVELQREETEKQRVQKLRQLRKDQKARDRKRKAQDEVLNRQKEKYDVTAEKGAGLNARRWLTNYKPDDEEDDEEEAVLGTGLTPGLAPIGYDPDSD